MKRKYQMENPEDLPENGISWRINYALDRKYKTRIPTESGRRASWVALQYDAHRTTVYGWLFGNREPRAPYLDKIAADTGVDKNWLIHGGENIYEGVPYRELNELDGYAKMRTYSLLNDLGKMYEFDFKYAGEMLDLAVTALVLHQSKHHTVCVNEDDDLALAIARMLNELSHLRAIVKHGSQP